MRSKSLGITNSLQRSYASFGRMTSKTEISKPLFSVSASLAQRLKLQNHFSRCCVNDQLPHVKHGMATWQQHEQRRKQILNLMMTCVLCANACYGQNYSMTHMIGTAR